MEEMTLGNRQDGLNWLDLQMKMGVESDNLVKKSSTL